MARQLNEMLLAKGWYLFSAGGAVFLLPYLYPFISSKGVSDPQIGLLAAVRPWLAAVAAMTGPALADKFKCHRSMMVGTFAASILLRASIYYAAEARYLLLFTVVIVSEYVAAPPGVLADAAVVALCSRQQGAASYGRQRLWGSIGWGGLSFAAGVLLDSCGYGAGFLVYLVLSAPCIYILARFSCGGGSSSSGGKGRGGSSSSRQGRKAASSMHGGEAGEGSAGPDAGGEECLHTEEAQLSAWPALHHEEALLPHAHEPFPFIHALVRTISGVPPTPSPPGPLPHRRRPPTPRLQGASRNQGDGDGSHASRHYYQQPVGQTSAPPPPPPALPPPVLMHLSTPFGYEEAQHPHGVSAAISIAAVEAATTIPAASDGSCQAGSQQRYSMMKLSSSVEAWIQRSETWIRQREREREAAAAAPTTTTTVAAAAVAEGVSSSAAAATMAVRAGAFLGSPGVSRHSAAAAAHGAASAALTAASDEEEQAGLLGPPSTLVPAAASTHTAATPAVHVVANIFGPACASRPAAAGAGHASISPAASYHVHAVAVSASAAAIPPFSSTQVEKSDCGGLTGKLQQPQQQQQLAHSDTLESIPLGSPATAIDNPDTGGGCSSKKPQCGMVKCPPSGGSGGGADGGAGGFLQRAGRLLSDGAVWLFLAKVFLLGFGTGTIGTWLFIYVSSLGASHALQGLMLTMNCVAEVPVFYFQESVTRRFPAGAILHVATGSLVLRLAAYAALPALPSPWFVLPVELMQGLTFALSWGTCCVHCKRIAPESLQATMQGLWQAVFNGLASGAGGLAGAVLHDRLGGRSMFAITAGLIFVGWLLLAAAEGLAALVAARRRRRAGSNPSDECVHLMNEEESGSGRGGSGGFGGYAGEGAQQQCLQVVVAAAAAVVVDNEKRALLAGGGEDPSAPHLPSSAAPTPSGARRGHRLLAARSLMGKAAGAGVSHVLRLALAGAWRHGFHTASAAASAAAAVTGAAPGSKPSPQGASSCGNTTRSSNSGPPSYDDVAADMTRGGLLYSFFVRRRTASIGGANPGISSGGAGSGASSPKQSLLLSQRRDGRGEHSNGGGSGGGDGSRRGMHIRGGSAVALASEALLATSDGGLIASLESANSDVAFDGGRDQGRQELMHVAACDEAAAPATGASTSGASASSGGSSDSGSSGSGSGMLDALGQAAAAASPSVLPASLATAWL